MRIRIRNLASFCIQVELFTLTGGGELKADYSLRAHTRVLTDLDWHTHNPDLLVTRWAASLYNNNVSYYRNNPCCCPPGI